MGNDADPSDIKALFGDRIRQLRDQRALSQQGLSDRSGVSKVFLGTVERGEKAIGLEAVQKLAHGLGVDPMELFRFGSMESGSDLPQKLGKKVAAFARGATQGRIVRFETIAKLYFEPDDRPVKTGRAGRKRRKRT